MFENYRPNVFEIIRSQEKDDQYISLLGSKVNNCYKQYFGIRSWLRWQHLIASGNKFLYYLLTTVIGNQTPGEENCNLIPITESQSIPSIYRRLGLALLYSFDSILIANISKLLNSDESTELKPFLDLVVDFSRKVDTTLLYFSNANYVDLGKHLLSIKYLSTLRRDSNSGSNSSLVAAYLSLVEMLLTLVVNYKLMNRAQARAAVAAEIDAKNRIVQAKDSHGHKCLICFSRATNPAATECGHVFCWHCLMDWLSLKQECPLCKHPVRNNRVIYLQNF